MIPGYPALRDRCRGQVPRAGISKERRPEPADHHLAAHRDHHDRPGQHGLLCRAPAGRCDRGGRCGDGLGGQPEGDRGDRPIVHPRASTSRSPRPRKPSAAPCRSSGTGSSSSRRDQERQLDVGSQGLGPGRAEGICHQPAGLPPDGTPVAAEFVIDAYRRRLGVEKSFRMAKSDLQA